MSNFKLNEKVKFLDRPVDGLQLLYAADIAVSGGGTMNRESSLLGTETYSIFTGKRPFLDEYLQELGKLKFIEDMGDFQKIKVERLQKTKNLIFSNNLVNEITDIFLNITKQKK
jgi:hypothetical protein